MFKKIKEFKWGYVILSLALFAVGVCLIAMNNALVALAITIGCMLAVFGIVFGAITLSSKERGVAYAFRIIFSVIAIVSGVVTAVFNSGTVNILISLFSLFLIIDASFKLNTAALSKRYSLPLWWIMLTLSVTVIASSFVMIKWTPENISTASVLLGVIFMVDGISNALSPFFTASIDKKSAEKSPGADSAEAPEEKPEETPEPADAPVSDALEEPVAETAPEADVPEANLSEANIPVAEPESKPATDDFAAAIAPEAEPEADAPEVQTDGTV